MGSGQVKSAHAPSTQPLSSAHYGYRRTYSNNVDEQGGDVQEAVAVGDALAGDDKDGGEDEHDTENDPEDGVAHLGDLLRAVDGVQSVERQSASRSDGAPSEHHQNDDVDSFRITGRHRCRNP